MFSKCKFPCYLLLIFTLLTNGCSPVTAANETLYLAMGDSITEGTGMAALEDTFVCQLSRQLGQEIPNLATYNIGKNGYTLADTLASITTKENEKLLKKASFITITTGGNDVLALAAKTGKKLTSKDYSKSTKIPDILKSETTAKLMLSYMNTDTIKDQISEFTKAFAKEFHTLVTKITTLNPDAKIVIQTVYNPFSGSDYPSLSQCIDEVLLGVNAVIAEEVAETQGENLLLLDTYTLFENQAETYIRIAEDDIHPTKKGHTLMAESIYSLLTTGQVADPSKDVIDASVNAKNSEQGEENLTPQQLEEGRNQFLTYVGISFVLSLIAFLLFKIKKI